MPLMSWTASLSVGIPSFDEEHAQLVGMMNQLYDAMKAGVGKEMVGRVLDGLIKYTRTHFAHEERVMQQHAYPAYPAHKAQHDSLTKRVLEVQNQYRAGKSFALSIELMNFLRDWLVTHIQGTDRNYQAYLTSKGVA
jgi:hemerythrin